MRERPFPAVRHPISAYQKRTFERPCSILANGKVRFEEMLLKNSSQIFGRLDRPSGPAEFSGWYRSQLGELAEILDGCSDVELVLGPVRGPEA